MRHGVWGLQSRDDLEDPRVTAARLGVRLNVWGEGRLGRRGRAWVSPC